MLRQQCRLLACVVSVNSSLVSLDVLPSLSLRGPISCCQVDKSPFLLPRLPALIHNSCQEGMPVSVWEISLCKQTPRRQPDLCICFPLLTCICLKTRPVLFPFTQINETKKKSHHPSLLTKTWANTGVVFKIKVPVIFRRFHTFIFLVLLIDAASQQAKRTCFWNVLPYMVLLHSYSFIQPAFKHGRQLKGGGWRVPSLKTQKKPSNLWETCSFPDTYMVQTCRWWLYVVSHSNAKLPGWWGKSAALSICGCVTVVEVKLWGLYRALFPREQNCYKARERLFRVDWVKQKAAAVGEPKACLQCCKEETDGKEGRAKW